jgi:hypothetical protein
MQRASIGWHATHSKCYISGLKQACSTSSGVMKRSAPTPAASRHKQVHVPVVDIPMTLNRMKSLVIAAVLLLLAAGAGLYYILPMQAGAGVIAFPLDDAWIAPTFARTLAQFGSYAYHELSAPTSGSTSPLFVFILAASHVFTGDVFIVPAAIGIASLAATAIFLFLLARNIFAREQWLAVAAALIFLLIPRVQSEAVSGMPTLLFTALITASAYWYFARRSVLFFASAGLALWVRPDALVFMIAALLHLLYHHLVVPREGVQAEGGPKPVTRRNMIIGAALFAVLLVGYFAFNLLLSGSLFPNTVPAKIAYYRSAGAGYLRGALQFYAKGPGAVLVVFAAFSVITTVIAVIRRRSSALLMAALFLLGMVAAYWAFLPILIDGGRYLVPTLPVFVLLGVSGIRGAFNAILRAIPAEFLRPMFNMLTGVLLLAAILAGVLRMSGTREQHYEAVRYIYDRGAGAGIWLGKHAPADAKVATHLIGTIGWYSHCRIIDLRGIVTPALIPSIGDLAALELALRAENIDYIATLREQFEVVNSNPVFLSNPTKPEVMEVYPYTKGQTHVMSQRASAVNSDAIRLMQRQDNQRAAALLRESVSMDPLSSRTFTLLGLSLLNMGDTLEAIQMFDNALKLHPEYSPAMVPLADITINRGDLEKGIDMLQDAVKFQRWSRSANSSLRAALQKKQQDSLRAAQASAGNGR